MTLLYQKQQNERSLMKKVAEVHDGDPLASLSVKVAALENHIQAFTTKEASLSQENAMATSSLYSDVRLDQK